MNRLRSTHPCPTCGAGVSLEAKFCGHCAAPQPGQPDRTAVLRTGLNALAARLRAAALIPSEMVDAMHGLGDAPPQPHPHVVIVGELGRGCRSLANRLAGHAVLNAGPSQRGAPARLERDPARNATHSLLAFASLEVAPPLAAGAHDTAEGVIGAVMRADVLIFALSAAQLLSATERRLLTAVAGLTSAPIALAVGRMNAIETDDDLDDTIRRTERFRTTLSPAPPVFLLPADTDDAVQLLGWVWEQGTRVGQQTQAAWEQRSLHLLASVDALLGAAEVDETEHPTLETLLAQLDVAHRAARAEALTTLEDGLSHLRSVLTNRLHEMTPEERIHEGTVELSLAIEALLRTSVETWRSALNASLATVELSAASLQAAADPTDALGSVAGASPRLSARLPGQSVGLMAAAVGLSVGVLLLPVGGSGAIAMGLGLSAGSVAMARVLRSRRDDELRRSHHDALDGWLREVGVRAEDWLVAHVESAHEQITERLQLLHAHAVSIREQTTSAALQRDLQTLLAQLTTTDGVSRSPDDAARP